MNHLLVTWFEPFGGEKTNASARAAALLPDRVGAWTLVKAELPVVFGLAGKRCLALVDEVRPDAVLMLGQAGGRDKVTPERRARNLRAARIPDNAGQSPQDLPIFPGEAEFLPATLPVETMTEAISRGGIPAALSDSAGTFVCNDLYYTVLRHLLGTDVKAAFLHVPAEKTMTAATAARALELAILALE